MTCFKQHAQHFAPQLDRLNFLMELELSFIDQFLIMAISCFKGVAIEIVKIGDIARAKKRPHSTLSNPFHEKIGDPVCGVHIVGSSPFIACIFS